MGSDSSCLQVRDASGIDGTFVEIWDCLPYQNQLWDIEIVAPTPTPPVPPTPTPPVPPTPTPPTPPPTSQHVQIKSRVFGSCLDLPGSNTDNGNFLWVWDCDGADNQQWLFDNDGQLTTKLD